VRDPLRVTAAKLAAAPTTNTPFVACALLVMRRAIDGNVLWPSADVGA